MLKEEEAVRVREALLRRIVSSEYSPGLRLPSELDLASEFGCGRSTVREALTSLAGLGVVKSRRGSGVTVLDFRTEGMPGLLPAYLTAGNFGHGAMATAKEMLRLRALLAGEAVRLAATYAPPGSLAPARAVLVRWSEETSAAEQAKIELEFFRSIVSASAMWPAVWLANAYFAPMREAHALLAPLVGGSPQDFAEVMSRVLARIEKRDPAGATREIERWLERVDRTLLDQFGALLEETPSVRKPPSKSASSAASTTKTRKNGSGHKQEKSS